MRKRKSSLAVGFPTIVNVLILLLFACVSMLSLSRAQSDYMVSSHGWDVARDYFEADSRAQTLLGEIEEAAALEPSVAGLEMEALLNEEGIAARYDQAAQILSFEIPAGEAGTLMVQLHLLEAGQYEVQAWELITPEAEEKT